MDVRATGGSLPFGHYLLTPLTVDKEGSKSLMALRVKLTQNRFPTNSLYTPIDNTPLHYILYQVCATRGASAALSIHRN